MLHVYIRNNKCTAVYLFFFAGGLFPVLEMGKKRAFCYCWNRAESFSAMADDDDEKRGHCSFVSYTYVYIYVLRQTTCLSYHFLVFQRFYLSCCVLKKKPKQQTQFHFIFYFHSFMKMKQKIIKSLTHFLMEKLRCPRFTIL